MDRIKEVDRVKEVERVKEVKEVKEVREVKEVDRVGDDVQVTTRIRRESSRPARYRDSGRLRRDMWTEVTKDLVSKEAIEAVGYDYEETSGFFYVIERLRYV